MFLAEDDAVPTIRARVQVGSTIYADESASWDALHAWFDAKRINHSIAFHDEDACTNQAESFFSRLRRAEIGQHHCISRDLGQYASEMAWREDNLVELHGVEILHAKTQPWKGIHKHDRAMIINNALHVLAEANKSTRAFGIIVDKRAIAPRDPVEYAFEEICNRFDLYLSRIFHRGGKTTDVKQRRLVIMDNSTYEETLQTGYP